MDSSGASDRRETAPLVSVVIPSFDSARHIRQCLEALRAQVTNLPFEIILVDSSKDGTDQIVANHFPEVRLFSFRERLSVGAARNVGVDQARGKVVLFLDVDCIAEPAWIDKMSTPIHRDGAHGVGGSVKNGTPRSVSGSIGFYLEFFRFLATRRAPFETFFLMGGNSGFSRDVLRDTPYENLSVGEDFLFSWKLAKQGKKIQFLPSASVTHVNRTGLMEVLRYQYELGLGAASYRARVSPRIMRVLRILPLLAFIIPPGVMAWIGGIILRRGGVLAFLRFVGLLPLIYFANNLWALGFYRRVKGLKSKSRE